MGRQRQKFSVELSQQLIKQQALNFLQQSVIFISDLTLKTFMWLDYLLVFRFGLFACLTRACEILNLQILHTIV